MTSQAGSGLKMDSVFNPFNKPYMFLQRMQESSYRLVNLKTCMHKVEVFTLKYQSL